MRNSSLILLMLFVISAKQYSQTRENHLKIVYDFEMNFNEKKKFESVLYISDNKSLFVWGNNGKQISEDDSASGYDFKINYYESDSVGSYNYTDLKSKELLSRTVWLDSEILRIKEDIPQLNWEILDEQKKIGNFNCQKTKTVFRGRTYFAWFTSEIPTSFGPWKLHGLPGLILNVIDIERGVSLNAKQIIKVTNKEFPILPKEDYREVPINEYAILQSRLSKDFKKKLMAKLPRGAEVEISSFETLERFEDQ